MRFRRRDFLKIVGAATAAAPLGCSTEPARRLIPYVVPPEDLVPGVATWYATTCRECPAGCGVLAKNRDGRIIKVEGNPLHPVNRGKLCARGQASLHGLYNPDRLSGPRRRNAGGALEPATWEAALEALAAKARDLLTRGRGDRIAFVSELCTGARRDLLARWLAELGQPRGPLLYEPFAYEALRTANERVFGIDGVPAYRLDRADFLLSLGAGFLETWLSNVEYARQFAAFRALGPRGRRPFIHVGPKLTLTANNADLWVPVAPGGETWVAFGVLRALLDDNLLSGLTADRRAALAAANLPPVADAASRAGVDAGVLRRLARSFAAAERPLVLAEGLGVAGPGALDAATAANLLCTLKPGTAQAVRFDEASAVGETARAADLADLIARMERGEVELLLVHGANPAYSLPPSWGFRHAAARVPVVVSFSPVQDETSALAHWVLPTHTPLECWGDHSPRRGVEGLLQPVMGPVFRTRQLEDVLLSTGRAVRGAERFPWADARELVRDRWRKDSGGGKFEAFWEECLARGGRWEEEREAPPRLASRPVSLKPPPAPEKPAAGELRFTAFPAVHLYDGRQANRSWIQEMPDPLSMVTWDAWAEIHPETARKLGLADGDRVRLRSPWGALEASVRPLPTVPEGTVAVPLGQGHSNYGRYAGSAPANPFSLFPPGADAETGGLRPSALRVTVERLGASPLAHTDGSLYQHDRKMAQALTHADLRRLPPDARGEIDVPLPSGFDPKKDFYPPHEHQEHRWVMAVDLDRCIGCGACTVACYAENNLGVVGRDQVRMGREMAWLRIQRYFEPDRAAARWLPMLCQHCDEAPCESVCPVFAPHHGREGLNNQVYNRCIGTRFCLQNDPYKVRRFNWFTFKHAKPLDLQLNPDVTVRQKGVMEKCSFCVQRIVAAKAVARTEKRPLKDGEFTTACAQTCPTDALIFGDLLNPESRVAKLIRDARAYQVLRELNTKPAVIYLKKVTETWEA